MAVGTVTIKSEEEIDLIRHSSLLVGKTLGEVSKLIEPGCNTLKMDQIAEEFIRDHGGVPAFKGYRQAMNDTPFPGSLCISINEEIVHGMPLENKYLQDGDVVSVDCGVLLNGYYGDCAFTFKVGNVNSKKKRLLKVTEESLHNGLAQAKAGNRIGDLSHAIQFHAESHGYSIVRELVGHGLGQNLHEPPEVPNFGRRRSGMVLQEGMVLAVEPMVNLGKRRIKFLDDGWTVVTADRMPSAHFEHTIVVRKSECEILSSHEFIVNQ